MAHNNPYEFLSKDVQDAQDFNSEESYYIPRRCAEELFFLPKCVHIFFLSADGKVSAFSEPSTLRIFRFKDTEGAESRNPTFIQVNGWTHPLIPGASPVLEAGNGAFMFPDVYGSGVEGSFVGIVLDDNSPFNYEGRGHAALSSLLSELTVLKKEESLPDERRLGKVGSAILKSAEWVSKGLEYGAEKNVKLIEYVTEKERGRTAQGQEIKVNPAIRTTAKGVKYATKATVKVSGFVANRVGVLTNNMSKYVAGKMEEVVSAKEDSGMRRSRSSMYHLMDAAHGGLLACGTLYAGLENAAKILGKSLQDESVTVVKHRYGNNVAETYEDSMTAAGNAAMTYMNVSSLGVKGLVKRTAKDTCKNLGEAVINAHTDNASHDGSKQNQ